MKTLRLSACLAVWMAATLCAPVGPAVYAAEPGPAAKAEATPAAERRAAIEAVMRKMESAVIAGDAAAYMALVDPSDAVFHKEQFNLAKDWAKNKAASFKLSIVEKREDGVAPELKAEPKPQPPPEAKPDEATPPKGDEKTKGEEKAKDDEVGATAVVDPVFDEQRAEFRMTMVWKMPDWKSERTLTLPVVFVRSAAGSWLYSGEKWDALVVPAGETFNGVRVLYEPGNARLKRVAGMVAKVMPEVRAKVDDHFRLKVPGPVTVKLYRSMRQLQASIWLSYSDGLSGWNEPGESIKIMPGGGTGEDRLRTLLAHEYGHCATFTMGPHATDAAWWVLEGSADLASSLFRKAPSRSRDNQVRSWMKAGEIADWEKLAPFPLPKEDAHLQGHVYVQGEHMLAFIAARYGDEARILFVRRMCEGKTIDQAAREAIGLPFADVDAAWRQSIQQQFDSEPRDDK